MLPASEFSMGIKATSHLPGSDCCEKRHQTIRKASFPPDRNIRRTACSLYAPDSPWKATLMVSPLRSCRTIDLLPFRPLQNGPKPASTSESDAEVVMRTNPSPYSPNAAAGDKTNACFGENPLADLERRQVQRTQIQKEIECAHGRGDTNRVFTCLCCNIQIPADDDGHKPSRISAADC